jgi:hypothetical protein
VLVAVAAIVTLAPSLRSQSGVPAPESVFGFEPGADNKLASYDQVVDYFRKVDAASDRVLVIDAGRTTQGRVASFALVSSAANLARIDRYREIARRLARPAGLSDEEARRLAAEGKAFVHIDGGLHSSEVAAHQHTPLLLQRLLSGDPEITAMLDDVIVMLWPTINPDGHQMVAQWFMEHAGTPEATQLPRLYQEFVGHDNNRDAYMLNMIESRLMEHAWRQWEPNIIYVHHQSSPFPTRIWLPPFAEPIATHAPFLMSREVNMIGMAIARRLEQEGKTGATHMGTGYDAWYAGYIDYTPMFKNIAAFWTETYGRGAGPSTTPPEQIQPAMRRPQSLYASPWPGGAWRLRDAVEYMTTASLATIEYASKYKNSLLFNRYQSGRDQIRRGRAEAPFAYVVPQQQRDPAAAVEMLRRLAFAGIRVWQLGERTTIAGEAFDQGAWIIPTDQEFAALLREVLDVQSYPEIRDAPDGPLDQPYDAAGWTLPMSMGVRTVAVAEPLSEDVRRRMRALGAPAGASAAPTPYTSASFGGGDAAPFDSAPSVGFDTDPVARAIVPPDSRVTGSGPALAVSPAENNAFKAVNLALGAGGTARYQPGGSRDASRYVIAGLPQADLRRLARDFALRAEAVGTPSGTAPRPRLGLLENNTGMDEGWTRWVLAAYGFDFVRVPPADLATGGLRDRIDVLMLTDDQRVLAGGGRGRGAGAAAPEQASANAARLKALDNFVRGGGTLVCFNSASTFAIDQLALPVMNVLAGVNRQTFFAGRSLMKVRIDAAHQVTAGMPDDAFVMFNNSPVFQTVEGFRGTVLARYPDGESPLASGFLLGDRLIQGKAAALDVEVGDGHVILFGFSPQWRGQTFGTFRMLFNAAMFGTAPGRSGSSRD